MNQTNLQPRIHCPHVSAQFTGCFFIAPTRQLRNLLLPLASIAAIASLATLLTSCDRNQLGVVDVKGTAPIVQWLSFSRDSVNIDILTPVGGTYSVSTVARAMVSSAGGQVNIGSVVASLVRPGSATLIGKVDLKDDGVAPDSVAGDGVFAGTIGFGVSREEAGTYVISARAEAANGFSSNTISREFFLTRSNAIPQVSGPKLRWSAPSGSDSVRFTLSVAARDSDGLGDLQSVVVRSAGTRDSSDRILLDNGLLANGDQLEGDGIFSSILWVKPVGSLSGVRFIFKATDRLRAVSDTIGRSAQNRPPKIESLVVPDTIRRPVSGALLLTFFETVSDSDGLGDIDSVFFVNRSSTSQVPVLLFDDGDLLAHGDSVRNDGKYSVILQITAANTPGPKDFQFYVVDRAGGRDMIIRRITIL